MSKRLSRFLAVCLLAVSASAMVSVSFDAEARRLGGGSSFGRQSTNVIQQRQATKAPSSTTTTPSSTSTASTAGAAGAATTAAARTGMSRWLGPIAGIAAGLGIAALLSSLGLSGAFLELMSTLVLVGLVVFAIMFLVRRLRGASAQPAMQQAGGMQRQGSQQPAVQPVRPAQASAQAPVAASAPALPADQSWFIPGDFDTAGFLANAKSRFIEIQAIWDSGNLDTLGDYMTDDLIAEIKPQLMDRKEPSHTEVVLLNAELLGIEAVAGGHLASVRYSGMLREEKDAEAFRFEEVWNLYKADDAGWLLAGIQQIPVEYAS
jgi:predicted lipid-binding transport protein (Tim44 family)